MIVPIVILMPPAVDPEAPSLGELTVGFAGREQRPPLRAPVGQALIEALRGYHDPRDQGPCDHCGGRMLDDNFQCRDCGGVNGVFGQLIAERAARFTAPAPITPPPSGG
jgi:hypothetical protein